ncbi:hypothetical protein D3C72_2409850 [compost metagenome]
MHGNAAVGSRDGKDYHQTSRAVVKVVVRNHERRTLAPLLVTFDRVEIDGIDIAAIEHW